MTGFFLAIHLNQEVRTIPLEKGTAEELDQKFARLAADYMVDRELVEYCPGYHPPPEEVMTVGYDLSGPLGKIRKSLPSALPALDKKTLENDPPVALVHVKPGESPTMCFQAVTKSNMMAPQSALFFGNQHFKFNTQVGLIPTNRIDALYEGGQLLFRNEHQVRRFLDMEEFFTEASDEVIEEFFASDNFVVQDSEKLKKAANKTMRRRIAMLSSKETEFDMKRIRSAAKRCGLSLDFQGTAMVIPSDRKGLKEAVGLLSDDYLGSLTQDDRLYFASFKRPIKGQA
ncbi:MAG: hypothetical protein B6A08_15470 [Sorangiineae bacterium NIC37A_2]|mgnify:CR=1 FL=1|jgi:hypothetical protein|nr:MAG: hypothetical protein B6A08_15470 [Sorangiineae bacterium NIC37A_2]